MNLKDSGFKTLNELVLIDTWWNVNSNNLRLLRRL
ncbi:hypothetical protein CLOL250_00475 [Clostridium sp. L2-50]|nr:hypothetical protein CLOL250_00475 [Clostridium sp. L2-50]